MAHWFCSDCANRNNRSSNYFELCIIVEDRAEEKLYVSNSLCNSVPRVSFFINLILNSLSSKSNFFSLKRLTVPCKEFEIVTGENDDWSDERQAEGNNKKTKTETEEQKGTDGAE